MTLEQFLRENILTLITFTPLAGALIVLVLPRNKPLVRWFALVVSLIPLALAILLWVWFQAEPCHDIAAQACFDQKVPWFPLLNASYHVGVDGISLTMVLLTAILTPLAVLISWSIEERVNLYMALFLMLEMGMLGLFVALDLLLFFVFWEFGLVPMYFLIFIWGSANRNYASFKFFIYTMAGSLGLLLSIQIIGWTMGTFDLQEIMARWPEFQGAAGTFAGVSITTLKTITFWLFTIAFAIKVPVWPFHTWLPDAHTEAPTAGSMILAGVLLKLGAYGFLRLVLPLFPDQAHQFAPVLAFLGMMAVVMGAYASWAQTDFKRLVAYSSVNHMGWVILAVAATAWIGLDGRFDPEGANRLNGIIAANGAVLQMFTHGLSSAAMFALVGMMYDRLHTRDLTKMGGLWVKAPVYGGIMMFSAMGSLGLPGLAGFVSEFMVVRGVWPVSPFMTLMIALSLIGLLFTGAYILKSIWRVLYGPLNNDAVAMAHGASLEINTREVIAMAPLLVLMLAVGLYPAWIVGVINATVTALLT
ncbi:MAG: NADH-quinone oxidoreductase subunit M [Anaerolineae bacterium]